MNLNNDQKVGLFKMMATKQLYEVGLFYGFDKYYKDSNAVKNAVYRIYNTVKNNPDEYLIQKDTYELVVGAVSARSAANVVSMRERMDSASSDIKSLITGGRDKTAKLIDMKLDSIGKSRKKLDNVSIVELSKVLNVLFDKGQIVQGEATEHIAVLGKIESGLSPEKLLEITLKQREKTIESKE